MREVARSAISDEAFAELSAMSLVSPFLEVRVEDYGLVWRTLLVWERLYRKKETPGPWVSGFLVGKVICFSILR